VPQLLKNVLSTYGVRIGGILAGVFLFPFVTHHVGLTQYGLWLLVSSVTSFFALDFGLGVSILRYVAKARAEEDEDALSRLVSTAAVFFLGLGCAATAAYGLFLGLTWEGLNVPASDAGLAIGLAVVSGCSAFLLGMPLGLFRTVLAGARRSDLSNALLLGQIVARTLATVVLLLSGFGILAVAVADLVVTTVGGLLALAACRRLLPALRVSPGRFDGSLLRSMTPYSLQVFLMTACGLVVMQADNVVIGWFMPMASVTLYAGAFRIYQTCRNLTSAMIGPLVPEAAHCQAAGQGAPLRSLLIRGTQQVNALALLVGVPTLFFAEPVLVAWAGPEFVEVADVARILVVGFLVSNVNSVAASLLTGTGRIGAYVRYHLIWAATNTALSILLVQRLGLTGVALGTTIPIVLLAPFYTVTALRHLDVPPRLFFGRAVLRPAASAAVAGLAIACALPALDEVGLVETLVLSAAYATIFLAVYVRFGLSRADRALYAGWVMGDRGGLLRGRV